MRNKLRNITICIHLIKVSYQQGQETNLQKLSCFQYAVICDSKVTFKIISKFYATAQTQFSLDLHKKLYLQ